jgi:hypothetical protein
VEALQQTATGYLLPSGCQAGGEEIDQHQSPVEEEQEKVNLMVNTLSIIKANLQHSIAASRILTGTVSGNGIDVTDTRTVIS